MVKRYEILSLKYRRRGPAHRSGHLSLTPNLHEEGLRWAPVTLSLEAERHRAGAAQAFGSIIAGLDKLGHAANVELRLGLRLQQFATRHALEPSEPDCLDCHKRISVWQHRRGQLQQ